MKFMEGKMLKRMEIEGKKVVFRLPKKSDARDCRDYINSLVQEKARILLVKKVTLSQEKRWLENEIKQMRKGKAISIFVETGGKVVGIGGLTRRLPFESAADHTAELHFGISKAYRRMGIAERLARFLFAAGKKYWNLRLIRSSYVSDNAPSASLHKKLGFKVVGKIPKGTKYGNKYLDEILAVKQL